MVQKVKCIRCDNMILTDTAERLFGYCAVCMNSPEMQKTRRRLAKKNPKSKDQLIEMLKSKFKKAAKNVENKNWEECGHDVIISTESGSVRVLYDRIIYNGTTIMLENIKAVEWMGRAKPDIQNPGNIDLEEFKLNNFDTLGFRLKWFRYFEITKLKQAYNPLLKYVEWAKDYGGL